MGQCVSNSEFDEEKNEWAQLRRVGSPFVEKIDAALRLPHRHAQSEKVYLFSSHHVMEYIYQKKDAGKRVYKKPVRISQHVVFKELPEPFSYKIDAAIPVNDRLCYLFSGNYVVNYNCNPTETGGESRILKSPCYIRDHSIFSQLPPPFLSHIEAAFVAEKTLAYFFSRGLVVAYDFETYSPQDRVKKASREIGKMQIFSQLPPSFQTKVDAAFGHPKGAYLFSGTEVVRYDMSKSANQRVLDFHTFSMVESDIATFQEEAEIVKSGEYSGNVSPLASTRNLRQVADGNISPVSPSSRRLPSSPSMRRGEEVSLTAGFTIESRADGTNVVDNKNFGPQSSVPLRTASTSKRGVSVEERLTVKAADMQTVRNGNQDSEFGAVTIGNDTAVTSRPVSLGSRPVSGVAELDEWLSNAPTGIRPEALQIFVDTEMGPGTLSQDSFKNKKQQKIVEESDRRTKSDSETPTISEQENRQITNGKGSLKEKARRVASAPQTPIESQEQRPKDRPLKSKAAMKGEQGPGSFKNTGAFSSTFSRLQSAHLTKSTALSRVKSTKPVKK